MHLILEKREQGVVLVLHEARGDTSKSRLEGFFLNLTLGGGVLDGALYFLKRSNSDLSEVIAEVLLLVVLDHLEHVSDSSVEVLLDVELLVGEVVDERPLLDVVVLAVDAHVLHLLLRVSQVAQLLLLSHVRPRVAQLLSLVTRVHVVENGELGTDEVGEVADLYVT